MTYTMRAAPIAAALATTSCILWNAQAPAWSGVAYLTERYLALILGLSLCALFLSVCGCLPKANRTSLVWRGHFLLGALYYTLLTPERIDRLMGQSNAGADGALVIDELVPATVASIKDAVQE